MRKMMVISLALFLTTSACVAFAQDDDMGEGVDGEFIGGEAVGAGDGAVGGEFVGGDAVGAGDDVIGGGLLGGESIGVDGKPVGGAEVEGESIGAEDGGESPY